MRPPFPPRHRRDAGVALIIVLAFVVLLTGLIVAFFARSVTGRQLSNSSANQTKAAVLAQSASDIVIAGFKSEIVAGSATPSPSPANFYVPLAAANSVPVRYPTPAPSPGPELIPNLVRESKRGDSANGGPLPTPAVPSYASAVNSATDSAVGGRKITPARWNSHFLIPSKSTATVADSTPDAAAQFTAPDWVLMTRNGPAVQTGIGTGTTALNNSAPNNGNFVIGRYAYAVYDEGGLLDMNVAGHPTPVTTPSQTGFTTAQVSRKGSLAMADLTQLPLIKAPLSPGDYLSQAMVDNLVGWRNYASAGFTGSVSYPNFTFSATQSASWFTNFIVNNSSGFLKVYGGPASNTGPTDQAFLSRQQLLKLRASLGFGANVLQYMGTFSRGLEQPSFVPAHIQYPAAAPAINNLGSSPLPSGNGADAYFGNNDAAGFKAGVAGQDLINPAFLSVRVGSSFPRLDGTTAVVGEPLVKRRFSLRRLAWITYKGPSANNLNDVNVKAAILAMGGNPTDTNDPIYTLVAQGNNANILKYFGLVWDGTKGVWTYNHGSDSIKTLADVAATNREPDCAELLKAAINAGSLAKGGPNLNVPSNSASNYQYTVDTTLDYNVLQILANLVDQFDTDSYPTVIQINVTPPTGANYYRAMRGVEDLPYFYRYHPFTVVTRQPSPLLSKTDRIAFTRVSNNDNFTIQDCKPGSGVNITDPGEAYLLWAADVWNPHDPNSTKGTAGSRPTRFRLQVLTQDPIGATVVWNSGARPQPKGSYYDLVPPQASIPVSYLPIVAGTTDFTFGDDGGKLFREPTLLWRADAPDNSNLAPESGSKAGPYKDVNTNVNYYGVCIGKAVLEYTASVSRSAFTANPQDSGDVYLFQASGTMDPIWQLPTGSYNQYTFRLQFQDPTTGIWVTYDEKYPDLHGLASPNVVVNPADWGNNQWQNPWWSNQMNDCATGYDPRVSRFGIGTQNNLTGGDSQFPAAAAIIPFLEAPVITSYSLGSNSALGNMNMGASKFTVMTTMRPGADKGNKVNYSNPCMTSNPGKNLQMRWFSGPGFSASNGHNEAPLLFSGLLDQNNPAITINSRNGGTPSQIYYEDPDGVARRAMGAYADTSLTAGVSSPIGLPQATANTFLSGYGVGAPTSQSQSRPLVLNRPFQSVSEMSYASRGGVWKQIDFFTPESGDTALLDTFCINDPPADGLVAGKVNLNTHQIPVLKAILSGSYRDEVSNYATSSYTPPGYAQAPLASTEAENIARQVYAITTSTTSAWRGPFGNVGEIVGRFIATPTGATGQPDVYTYKASASSGVPTPNNSYTYAGLSAWLDGVYSSPASIKIQRMRESAIRPLSDAGQTRVWNLLIDVVAQTGRYGSNATTLSQFGIEGEKRCWIHVAIDRYTGEIIDRQTEEVNE